MPREDEAEVREWLKRAFHDLDAARALFTTGRGGPENIAFHCQQSVEKSLKGYLVSRRMPFAKVHDLEYLIDLCARHDPTLDALRDGVEPLTQFAVMSRYPTGADPDPPSLTHALEVAERVLAAISERTATLS